MKKLKLILMILILLIIGSLFNSAFAQQDLENEFDKTLSDVFKKNEPGAVVLIARNGEIIYEKPFGMANLELDKPMEIDNIFRIGSITKQFTAIAILQLMEKGKLSLQDEITKFIPAYPAQGYRITIEHLLSHTSGIRSYTAMDDFINKMSIDVTPIEMIDHFKNEPLKFEPGTKWEYSNSGYFLLGYIIQVVTGKTYAEYLENNFFKPLGMKSSLYGSNEMIVKKRADGYILGKNGYENAKLLSMTQPYSAGSIQSTVGDLFKWHKAVHSYKLISKENLQNAFTKYKLSSGIETDYGYGWGLGIFLGSPTIDHGGGINGFKTMEVYLPEQDVFVAVFTNCECYSPKDIAYKLAAITIGKPVNSDITIMVDREVLETYTGEYEVTPEFSFKVTNENDKLFVQATGQEKFEIFPETESKFFLKVNDAQIEFVKDLSGKIIKAILYQGGRKTDAKKIK